MATRIKKRKFAGSKKRFIGKPNGQIQERVQSVGPERFGIVSVDCAKRRSKWMLCNFYGKVVVEPTTVEHTAGGLRAMTQRVAEACRAEGLTDTIVAVEMTGVYHKPVQRAFRKAGFDTRIVHPFASNHYRRPLHPNEKTDDHDLEAIFHAAIKGYGLATLPVGEAYQSLQAVSRHRHSLVKQRSRLMVQMRRLLHQTMPGFADLFEDDKLFHKSIALPIALEFSSAEAIRQAGVAGIERHLTKIKVRYQTRTIERIVAWAGAAAEPSELARIYTRQ
jgi:transposase